jgi:2-hydroxychromene-2-carboxylate isomerase
MRTVRFFFGIGSRYSYLAATQVPRLAGETGARFDWRAIHSPELIAGAGPDPFRAENRRGQYDAAYRTRDAMRWARYYGVGYHEPPWAEIDWKLMALGAVAADSLGAGEAFATRLFRACFAEAKAPRDIAALVELAQSVGLPAQAFRDALASPATAARHRENLEAARAAGAFGVPSFVLDDGQLFWGQDRLPLLRQELLAGTAPLRGAHES